VAEHPEDVPRTHDPRHRAGPATGVDAALRPSSADRRSRAGPRLDRSGSATDPRVGGARRKGGRHDRRKPAPADDRLLRRASAPDAVGGGTTLPRVSASAHVLEQHKSHRIPWLRAAVLGANDGIVTVASLVIGVAAANSSRSVVVTAGVAGLIAGAMSMATGEYISVSSQRDAEHADL